MAAIGTPLLLTGGTGRLGKELRRHANFGAPKRQSLNILSLDDCRLACSQVAGGIVVHSAAFINATAAEENRRLAWDTNVEGTRNLQRAARFYNCRFVYVSTDYVFDGQITPERGYSEESIPNPINFYGLTKLLGEQIALTLPNSLVIRAPFRQGPPWPWKQAFTDQYTSARFPHEVAPDVVAAALSDLQGIIHIGGPCRSIFEMARSVSPDVKEALSQDLAISVPRHIGLDSYRWKAYCESKVREMAHA